MNGSKLVGYSRFRIFGNFVFNTFASIAARRRIFDLGSGLNMYKTNYLANKFYLGFPNNLTFNVYMLYYGIWTKSNYQFFPLTWREEDQISNAKLFRQSQEILFLSIQYLFASEKLFSKQPNMFSLIDYQSEIKFTQSFTENSNEFTP
jgi:hypothetical protein